MRGGDKLEAIKLYEEFSTVYQPIVDLETKKITGYESLLRGPKPTDQIIQDAQVNGTMIDLDLWSSKNAVRHVGADLKADQKIFINIHPRTFSNRSQILHKELITRNGLKGSQVVVEITEHEPIEKTKLIHHKMKLNEMGVSIAFDDVDLEFDLSLIGLLRPQYVKLDRLVTNSLEQSEYIELVKTIVRMAELFDFKIIAEGLEEESQIEKYREYGVKIGQGWILGKPQRSILERKVSL